MPVTIRPARAEEVPYLCHAIAGLPLWRQLRIKGEELEFACANDPERRIVVADAGGNYPVGCIMFRPVQGVDFLCRRVFRSGEIFAPGSDRGMSPSELPNGGYVNMLAMFEGSQGLGIGAQLLSAAEEETRNLSDRIYLCVSQINPRGRKFYEREGYQCIAEARDCIRPGNQENLMLKYLGPR
jgi:GNAT superfamily N-acetyltransferase